MSAMVNLSHGSGYVIPIIGGGLFYQS